MVLCQGRRRGHRVGISDSESLSLVGPLDRRGCSRHFIGGLYVECDHQGVQGWCRKWVAGILFTYPKAGVGTVIGEGSLGQASGGGEGDGVG